MTGAPRRPQRRALAACVLLLALIGLARKGISKLVDLQKLAVM